MTGIEPKQLVFCYTTISWRVGRDWDFTDCKAARQRILGDVSLTGLSTV
jgi:hypothetical protein